MKLSAKEKGLLVALGTWLAVLPILSYVHEFGHGLVCYSEGLAFTIDFVWIWATRVTCFGAVNNLVAYYFAGGGLAAVVALFLTVTVGRLHKGIAVGLIALAIGHIFAIPVELVFQLWYSTNQDWASVILILLAIVSLCLCLSAIRFEGSPTKNKADKYANADPGQFIGRKHR